MVGPYRRRHRIANLAVASLHHGPVGWPVSRGCQKQIQCHCWYVQKARGRPGRRLQSPPSEQLDARPTWQCRALCAGEWSPVSEPSYLAEYSQTTSSDEVHSRCKPERVDISECDIVKSNLMCGMYATCCVWLCRWFV